MKKIFAVLNIILFAATVTLCIYYDIEGGLGLKALTGSGFAALGLVNLIYAILSKVKDLRYPIWMALGLIICLTGDIVLNIEFIPGALIFAVGHLCYFVAYSMLMKLKRSDAIPISVIFIVSVVIIKLVPILDFGSALMEWICIGYALVISCMVGKTVSNFISRRNSVTALLLAGSVLFYFSDLMLVLCRFGDAPKITDTLCLYSYFPAQCLLALSVFNYVNKEKTK